MRSGEVIGRMRAHGHEQVVYGYDEETGLQVIIAIHSSALGPALGGTRYYPYGDEEAALTDVLRLAEGMSLKSAAAGLDLGGGKAVIIGDPGRNKTPELLGAYGRLVDSLQGRYITAEDVGTTVEDMVVVSGQTRWVTGLPVEAGGSGDPSPMTARGVAAAMRAAVAHFWGSDDLSGRRVAIQGVGKVGSALAQMLAAEGCHLVVADVDGEAVARARAGTGAEMADVGDILSVDCDFLAPCALGGVLSASTIPSLRCAAVVGSANNQLEQDADAERLADAGVLYVPDFVANAGGVINIAVELEPSGYREDEAARRVEGIFDQVSAILKTATRDGTTPLRAAMQIARERIASAKRRSKEE